MTSVKKLGFKSVANAPSDLAELKEICKEYGIYNTVEYRKRYKDVPGLPAHPERMFHNEWSSYSEFFDIPQVKPYQKLKSEVQKKKIKNQREYKAWVSSINDPGYPRTPHEVYGDEWENWYEFCGKEKPFRPEFIESNYHLWAEKIQEFMKQAKGGGSKVSHLCRFVRIYVEKYDQSRSPQELLTKEKVNIRPFREELKRLNSDNSRRGLIIAVNEFLDYVVAYDLTDEDEETGEIVRVMNARNPFQLLADDKSVTAPIRNWRFSG